MSTQAEEPNYATVVWEGDSRDTLQRFPESVRQNLGFQLWQLQQGERPTDYRPLPTVGPGVFELRDQDQRAWYRLVYLSRTKGVIYVLHCFEKKSRQMPRKDFEMVRRRLRAVRVRIAQEKANEKAT